MLFTKWCARHRNQEINRDYKALFTLRGSIDLRSIWPFIRAECERSHFFEINLGSVQPGSLQEVVWDRSKIDLRCSVLSENANTSWKRSSLVAFPHWESRKPIARVECWFCKLQKNVCKKGEKWRKELLSLLGVTVGFTIKQTKVAETQTFMRTLQKV